MRAQDKIVTHLAKPVELFERLVESYELEAQAPVALEPNPKQSRARTILRTLLRDTYYE